MQRFGSIIKLKPEKEEEYKRLHAAVWPEVLDMIRKCQIRNYSIFLNEGFLFSYFEYYGKNFEADMQRMADDPHTQAWWELTDPCQEPLANNPPDVWWAVMEEVFHTD